MRIHIPIISDIINWINKIFDREEKKPDLPKDELDPGLIHWNDYDISNWEIEPQPFDMSVSAQHISWTFKQSHWPYDGPINGNMFFIWKEGDKWYGESFEHIRGNAHLIGAREVKGGGKLRSKPDDWRPVRGEIYYLVLASHCRGWKKTEKRTNIEKIIWKR